MKRLLTFKRGQRRIMSATRRLACLSRVGTKWSALVVAGLLVCALAASSAQAATGDVLRTIGAANPQGCGFTAGLAFNGTNLLVSCRATNVIDVVKPSDGSLVSEITATSESGLGGLAFDATRGKVWACSPFSEFSTGNIVLINPATGASSNMITLNREECADRLAYDASDDTLWHAGQSPCTVEHIKTDGSAIATFPVCNLLGTNVQDPDGIAVGGQTLYMGGGDNGRQIYAVNKNFTTSSLQFQTPFPVEDLECDDVTFAPKTALWAMDSNAHTLYAFEIPAGSCNFGGGSGPHWYSNGQLIPQGQPEPVTTSGQLTFHVAPVGFTATCTVKDKDTIENPVGGGAGTDKLKQFRLSGCSGTSSACTPTSITAIANPRILPWLTHLIPGAPIRDVIQGINLQFTVQCGNGAFSDNLAGTLMPTMGSSVDNFGAGSGELRDPANRKATVTGTDSLLGPPGDEEITAQTP